MGLSIVTHPTLTTHRFFGKKKKISYNISREKTTLNF